jgi:small-conductance mechanosensitive channel
MHTIMQILVGIVIPIAVYYLCVQFKKWVQKIVNEEINKRGL